MATLYYAELFHCTETDSDLSPSLVSGNVNEPLSSEETECLRKTQLYFHRSHWIPLTTSKNMQKKLIVIIKLFDFTVKNFDAKKFTR